MDLHVSLIGRTDLTGEIYRQLRGAIRDGRLRRGDRLPPTRELARRLNVSRTTVTIAYERLMGEGFLIARVGAGTFVSDQISAPASRTGQRHVNSPLRARPFWEAFPPFAQAFVRPAEFDFRSGLPDASLFPYGEWRRAVAQQLHRVPSDRGVYGPPGGHQALRDSIARHIGTSRGVQTAADDVTVTNGTQQALDVVARVLLAPGDRIAIEAPGYSSARVLFESLGARVIGVRVDEAGLAATTDAPCVCDAISPVPARRINDATTPR
jgi:GntR family transcriptional regulator/MocR family aminotransferase